MIVRLTGISRKKHPVLAKGLSRKDRRRKKGGKERKEIISVLLNVRARLGTLIEGREKFKGNSAKSEGRRKTLPEEEKEESEFIFKKMSGA